MDMFDPYSLSGFADGWQYQRQMEWEKNAYLIAKGKVRQNKRNQIKSKRRK